MFEPPDLSKSSTVAGMSTHRGTWVGSIRASCPLPLESPAARGRGLGGEDGEPRGQASNSEDGRGVNKQGVKLLLACQSKDLGK